VRICLSEEQKKLDADGGIVIPYMHNSVAPGLGKIGVLVVLKSDAPVDKLSALGKQIAMHVAATAPQSLRIDDLDPVAIERERAVLTEQAKESGRPENIIEKNGLWSSSKILSGGCFT